MVCACHTPTGDENDIVPFPWRPELGGDMADHAFAAVSDRCGTQFLTRDEGATPKTVNLRGRGA